MTNEYAHRTLSNPDSQNVLKMKGMYIGDDIGADWLAIYDEDGNRLFTVEADISPHALGTIVGYGDKQFNRGYGLGRRGLKAQLLGLLGAQPLQGD
jgi:hypothetical protein